MEGKLLEGIQNLKNLIEQLELGPNRKNQAFFLVARTFLNMVDPLPTNPDGSSGTTTPTTGSATCPKCNQPFNMTLT